MSQLRDLEHCLRGQVGLGESVGGYLDLVEMPLVLHPSPIAV